MANLVDDEAAGGMQLSLPFEAASTSFVDDAFDSIRDRFGASVLTRAATLGSDPDEGVPLLPD